MLIFQNLLFMSKIFHHQCNSIMLKNQQLYNNHFYRYNNKLIYKHNKQQHLNLQHPVLNQNNDDTYFSKTLLS